MARRLWVAFFLMLAIGPAQAQKWVNPPYDAHRLDYRDLGYPDVTAIEADSCPITSLLTGSNGRIYGATSGKASYLFVYDRSINKVRPLGRIGEAKGVYHSLVQDAAGTLILGGGLNILGAPPLTKDFRGGFRQIEEQLWRDIAAPYSNCPGGHLYRYDPAKSDGATRLADEPCPLEDLGVPVRGNSIYALAIDAKAGWLYGLSYPDARFFAWDLKKHECHDVGPAIERKVYSGPERNWRTVPRALFVAPDGKVYTSGEDGHIICYDRGTEKLARTKMLIPGEYWEAWSYHGFPVVEQFLTTAEGNVFGSTSDGFLFKMDVKQERLTNLGKARVSRRVRAMTLGQDGRIYMICGEFQEPCKLYSFDMNGHEGFRDWGVLAVDRSPYYAKRAYQFDAMTTGVDGTVFIGESDRRAALFLFYPGGQDFEGGFNPSNPR